LVQQSPITDPTTSRLDARLVPAAVTSWVVTAAGILWPIGNVVGSVCAAASVSGALLWRAGSSRTRMRAVGMGLVAVGVVGTGFGFAIALRANAVAHHPVTAAFGTSAEVVVAPTESAVSVGHGRLMFRATLRRLGHDDTSARPP
jgi:competence protein ComEC